MSPSPAQSRGVPISPADKAFSGPHENLTGRSGTERDLIVGTELGQIASLQHGNFRPRDPNNFRLSQHWILRSSGRGQTTTSKAGQGQAEGLGRTRSEAAARTGP